MVIHSSKFLLANFHSRASCSPDVKGLGCGLYIRDRTLYIRDWKTLVHDDVFVFKELVWPFKWAWMITPAVIHPQERSGCAPTCASPVLARYEETCEAMYEGAAKGHVKDCGKQDLQGVLVMMSISAIS